MNFAVCYIQVYEIISRIAEGMTTLNDKECLETNFAGETFDSLIF